jgi:hypothetical protein
MTSESRLARKRASGSDSGSPVRPSTVWKTSRRGLPAASSARQPVNCSATEFIIRMFPSAPVEMTPSPIAWRVTWDRSFSSESDARARMSSRMGTSISSA